MARRFLCGPVGTWEHSASINWIEGVLILGGARGMQALIGGSTHSANMAAMLPIRTALEEETQSSSPAS